MNNNVDDEVIKARVAKFRMLNTNVIDISSVLLGVREGKEYKVYNTLIGSYMDSTFKHFERLGNDKAVLFGVENGSLYRLLYYPNGASFRYKHSIFIVKDYIDRLGIDIVGEYSIDQTDMWLSRIHFLNIIDNKDIGSIDARVDYVTINIVKAKEQEMIKVVYNGLKRDDHNIYYIDKAHLYNYVDLKNMKMVDIDNL